MESLRATRSSGWARDGRHQPSPESPFSQLPMPLDVPIGCVDLKWQKRMSKRVLFNFLRSMRKGGEVTRFVLLTRLCLYFLRASSFAVSLQLSGTPKTTEMSWKLCKTLMHGATS